MHSDHFQRYVGAMPDANEDEKPDPYTCDMNDLSYPEPDRTAEESVDRIGEAFQIEEWKSDWVDDHADGE